MKKRSLHRIVLTKQIKKNNVMEKQNGFTLIEMMLVIAVIAFMSALALMSYRRHAETARIDKISIEMQHLLEAALAYNVDHNGVWPDSNNEELCASSQPDLNNPYIKNYIPNREVQSSYGTYFCWSSEGVITNGSHESPRLFWVALKVPHNNVTIARRIAARLPNAIITSDFNQIEDGTCDADSCYVRAEVVQPATSHSGGAGMMVAIGDCPSRNDLSNSNKHSSTCRKILSENGTIFRINFSACANNEIPRVIAFPNYIRFPKDNFPGFTVKDIEVERTNSPCTVAFNADGEKRQNCDVSVHATTCIGAGPYKCRYIDIANAKHPGSMGASYMVACVSKGKY